MSVPSNLNSIQRQKLAIGRPRIGFVTCADLSHSQPSRDNPLFPQDCAAAAKLMTTGGADVVPLVWDGPRFFEEGRACDLVVVRSPWDYMESAAKREEFVHWLARLQSEDIPCENSPQIMMWNLDKQYLSEFARAGVPIVPTRFVDSSESFDLGAYFASEGAFVLKPSISAGAHDTFKFLSEGEARDFQTDWERIRPKRRFMVQPFLREISDRGEWSSIFFDGSYSHSVHKLPGNGQWLVQKRLGGSVLSKDPPSHIRELAERTVLVLSSEMRSERILYARVDVIDALSGPLLSEVELIEPELFFLSRHPTGSTPNVDAIERFWRAIQSRLEARDLLGSKVN